MHGSPGPGFRLARFTPRALRLEPAERRLLEAQTERVLAAHPAWPLPLIEEAARRRAERILAARSRSTAPAPPREPDRTGCCGPRAAASQWRENCDARTASTIRPGRTAAGIRPAMTAAQSAPSPPPTPAGTTADDLRAAQDFAARQQPGWAVEELFADAGAVLLGLTPPRPDGSGDLAWVVERAQARLRVFTADCSVLGEFAEMRAALDAIERAEALARKRAAPRAQAQAPS
jgi:hypothetical protein